MMMKNNIIKAMMAVLIISTIAYSLNSSYLIDEMGDACTEVNGKLMCLELYYNFDIPIKFTSDATCYAEEITTNSEDFNVCYATILLDNQKLITKYITSNSTGQIIETEDTDTYSGSFETALVGDTISIIDFTKCNVDEANVSISAFYEYTCPLEGKTAKATISLGVEDTMVIENIQQSSYEIIIYIIIGAVIVLLAYLLLKKKK